MDKSIWYISKYFAPETNDSPGGRGWLLTREMAKQGHDITVITSDSNNLVPVPTLKQRQTQEVIDGVTLVWLKTLKYKVAKSMLRIISWLHFEWNLFFMKKKSLQRPDIIVVSSLSLLTILNGFMLRRKYKCKLAFEIRDIWPLTITEEGGFSTKNPLVMGLQFIEKLGYKKSDIIIGTMPNLQEHVESLLGQSREAHCIPMGVLEESSYKEKELTQSYVDSYLSSKKFKVLYAGTVGITNALGPFFEAAIKLQDNQDIEFILVGDGALREEYISKYEHLPNLTFAPKVAKDMVQSVLSSGDLLYFSVHLSKVWDYGQSLNKVIDYMRSGKPIVASYTGYPSMINEAGCGSFVPAKDVEALVNEIIKYSQMNHDALLTLGQSGKEWLYENRSYKKLADDFLSILID